MFGMGLQRFKIEYEVLSILHWIYEIICHANYIIIADRKIVKSRLLILILL